MKENRSQMHKKTGPKWSMIFILSLITIIFLAIPVWGLSKFYQKPTDNKTKDTTHATKIKSASFSNNVFTTETGVMTFIQSKFLISNTPVIIVDFEYKNNSRETNTAESVIWNNIEIKQKSDSEIKAMGYYVMNNDDPYYDDVAKSSELVNPGETIKASYGFRLANEISPLIMEFLDNNKKVIGTKEIVFSKELALVSPSQEFTETHFTTNQESTPLVQNDAVQQENQNDTSQPEDQSEVYQEIRSINSESEAVALAVSMYGDNNGDWSWVSMGETDGGYFIKAISAELLQTTMTGTVRSLNINYDGTVIQH